MTTPRNGDAARPVSSSDLALPLHGLRVLDFSRVLAGPFLTQCLASLGADVVKVEPPEGDPTRALGPPEFRGVSYYFHGTNGGKRSIVLDLREMSGLDTALRLATCADVVVENFRPGVMEKLGLGAPALRALNPRLVCLSITGFGADAPVEDRSRPSFDLTVQARSGALSVNGEAGARPVRLGIPTGDLAGALFGCIALLAALVKRQESGGGAALDLSLLESQMALLGTWLAQASISNVAPSPVGSGHASAMPYDVYETSDGLLAVAVFTDRFWRPFVEVLDMSELADDVKEWTGPDRVRERERLDARIRPILKSRTRDHWLDAFRAHGIPAEAVSDVCQALDDPVLQSRGTVRRETDGALHWDQLAFPAKFDGHIGFAGAAPTELGGDRDSVLREWLGLSPSEIGGLTREGAFGRREGD